MSFETEVAKLLRGTLRQLFQIRERLKRGEDGMALQMIDVLIILLEKRMRELGMLEENEVVFK